MLDGATPEVSGYASAAKQDENWNTINLLKRFASPVEHSFVHIGTIARIEHASTGIKRQIWQGEAVSCAVRLWCFPFQLDKLLCLLHRRMRGSRSLPSVATHLISCLDCPCFTSVCALSPLCLAHESKYSIFNYHSNIRLAWISFVKYVLS